MQTSIAERFRDSAQGKEADSILRACVHCGFCTATCPTYQLLGDELDGPRGRIYLIKQFLEGQTVSRRTQAHLDRCLTCRSCETTCPSGVRYGRLADIGRSLLESELRRPFVERMVRRALRAVIPYPRRFGPLVRMGQWVRPILPGTLADQVPPRQAPRAAVRVAPGLSRRMLVLDGCAQSVATPNTNDAATRVLARLGIELVSASGAGCCGAVSHHLSALSEARAFVRRNIDAWWPHVEAGVEALVISASGCGAVVKDYGEILADDPDYANKAARIAGMTRDLSEVLAAEDLATLGPLPARRVAFHSPCTLQHGQRLNGVVEAILSRLGFELTPVPDPHLCCGSAGTYSILQASLSSRLRANKVSALASGDPEVIVTANVGCQLHLAAGTTIPVMHWIELLADSGQA